MADLEITYRKWASWQSARLTVRDEDGSIIQELVATGETRAKARRALITKAYKLSQALQKLETTEER